MRSAKSLKAKGKYLQNVVLQKIIDLFPYLKKKDIIEIIFLYTENVLIEMDGFLVKVVMIKTPN